MHVVDAAGANVVTGHDTADNVPVPENAVSFTVTPCNVTLPVLVTRNEYVTELPAADTTPGLTDFTIEIAGPVVTGTLTTEGGEGGIGVLDPGGVPVVVALSFTLPLSRSAWVTV